MMEIVLKKISELSPYEKNPRNNDDAVEPVAESIKKFGFKVPMVIDKNGIIITGHTRYKAAKKIGLKEVPCILADDLTDEQVKAFRLADNKVGEFATWDESLLTSELSDISIDMDCFGFTGLEEAIIENEEKPLEEDNYEPEIPKQPKSKVGDIYKLGNHRLMCGDSTNAEHFSILMGDELADLVLTDPPYNVAIGDKNKYLNEHNGTHSIEENIIGDSGMTDEEIGQTLWLPAFEQARNYSKDCCSVYASMPQGGTHMMMMMMIKEAGWQVKHELIWVKNAATFSMHRLDYDYKHEPILYGWNKSHKFIRNDYETSVFEDDTDFSSMKKEQLIKLLEHIFSDKYPSSILKEDKPRKCDLHPTMKPIKLFGRLIKNSTNKNDIVLDIFGGSGTSIIACEELDRRCFMMEYDPVYVDVIIDRWEKFTGLKAEKLN